MPRHHHAHGSLEKKGKTVTVWLWTCHICAVAEMTVLTTSACVNCVHVRCPECEVEQVEIKASR